MLHLFYQHEESWFPFLSDPVDRKGVNIVRNGGQLSLCNFVYLPLKGLD